MEFAIDLLLVLSAFSLVFLPLLFGTPASHRETDNNAWLKYREQQKARGKLPECCLQMDPEPLRQGESGLSP